MSPARRCAFRVLRRVSADDAFADRAFEAEAERAALDPRERALAQQLAYGAIQRRVTLDHVLSMLASRAPDAIDPPLRDALHLGLFQLVYLDRVPDYAAVTQTVELAKAERRAHGFVNAVMRSGAREARGIVAGLRDATPAEAALLHSHPEWLARMWWEMLGPDEARALMAANNRPPESAVRVNTLVASRDEVAAALRAEGVPLHTDDELPDALVLDAAYDVHGSDHFARGALMPQSRASMRVAHALAPRPGERVLDMCAAPGAKTTHVAALMEGRGEVVAVERHDGRCAALREHCERMGAVIVGVRCGDARVEAAGEQFDRVLLDAPCSDLGTLRSRPDARWRRTPSGIEELAALQAELLDAAAALVRPGGTLVYSTCTISERENEGQVEAFLGRHPAFEAPGGELPIRTLPHRDNTDGFFIACLARRSGPEPQAQSHGP